MPLRQHYAVASDTHPELPLDPDASKPGTYKWPLHITPRLMAIVWLGGCGGASARYWVSLNLQTGSNWPAATFTVNLLGAFLLGLLLEGLARLGDDAGPRRIIRLLIGTGFIGAFTTYSTLAVETDLLIKHEHVLLAVLYVAASMSAGIVCSAAGIQFASAHHRARIKTP
jgi:CrcB protein